MKNLNYLLAIIFSLVLMSGSYATTNSNVRYVKFESFYSDDDGQVNVYEIKVNVNGVDVALNKPTAATSSVNDCCSKGSQEAVDGNNETRWSSDRNTWKPDSLNPQSIVVDLQEIYIVNTIIVNISGWDSRKQTFDVLASTDSVNWNKIGSGIDTTGTFAYVLSDLNNPVSFNPDTCLVGYYPFNGNANDYSKFKNNGIVNGATLTTDRNGNENSAYYFNGVDNTITLPDSLRITNNFTIAFWVLNQNSTGTSDILSDGSAGISGNDFLINMTNNSIGIRADKDNFNLNYEDYSPNKLRNLDVFNKWVHIAWVMTPDSSTVYLNGNKLTTINEQGSDLGYRDSVVTIGARKVWQGADKFLLGKLDELKIYNMPLDSNQIQSLYKGTAFTGVAKLNDNVKINVYPNPASDMININLTSKSNDNYQVKIYNMTGSLLQTLNKNAFETNINVSLKNYPTGVYMVNLSSANVNKSIRVVKK